MTEAWDPVVDFHKLRWWIFEEVPGAEEAFLDGYRARLPDHAHFDERFSIVEVLELVNLIANAPEIELAKRARSRLQEATLAAGWPDPTQISRAGS